MACRLQGEKALPSVLDRQPEAFRLHQGRRPQFLMAPMALLGEEA
jgi:hypothetical protein